MGIVRNVLVVTFTLIVGLLFADSHLSTIYSTEGLRRYDESLMLNTELTESLLNAKASFQGVDLLSELNEAINKVDEIQSLGIFAVNDKAENLRFLRDNIDPENNQGSYAFDSNRARVIDFLTLNEYGYRNSIVSYRFDPWSLILIFRAISCAVSLAIVSTIYLYRTAEKTKVRS